MLDGGSDDAGFVQVIQGRLDDPSRFREFMSQPMDLLHEARPEIIGGTIAIDADGWFTETMAFRSEAEARTGEQREMPPEMAEQFNREMDAGARHALPRPAPPVVRQRREGCSGHRNDEEPTT